MKIVASAKIGGAVTNRVTMTRTPRAPRRKRYRKDRTVQHVKAICVSLTPKQLALIDAECERLEMARSEFLRGAALLVVMRRP